MSLQKGVIPPIALCLYGIVWLRLRRRGWYDFIPMVVAVDNAWQDIRFCHVGLKGPNPVLVHVMFIHWWLSTMLGIIVEYIVEWLPFAIWLLVW